MNKAQLQILKDEITADPLVRGYSGMTDSQKAVDLNTVYRERNLSRLDATTMLNAIVKSEYAALTDANKDRVWQILHMGEVDPFGIETDMMIDIFGGGSATIAVLADARMESISRGIELGLGTVTAQDVTKALNNTDL